MKRFALAGVVLTLVHLGGCGQQQEAAPVPQTPVPQAAPVAPPPPPQAVGKSCSADCGGTTVSIQCAEGETPACDCAATPQASCKVPAG